MIPHKNIVILVAAFVSIMLLIVARHHPPSRRKIKEIWHGHVYWEGERDTTVNVTNMSNLTKYDTTMLRSSPEKAFENVEPSQISEPSTKLENVEPSTNLPEMTFTPPKRAAQLPTATKSMIAICAATRSKNWRSLDDTNLQNTLIPSIERTISISDRSLYDFRLYLAADHDDHFWLKNQNNVKAPFWLSVHVGFYEGPEHKIPFNPMMRAAYNDGAEYMVRINDDSEFVTSGWVSKAVSKLASYDPPNVGVVGPTCADNAGILTHDMVHRTHLDIFEYYYPRVFSAWWIDDWITYVYGAKRSAKMINWTVNHHTGKYGTRYNVQYQEQQLLKGELEKGAAKIEAWLEKSPFAQIRPSDIIVHGEIRFLESRATACLQYVAPETCPVEHAFINAAFCICDWIKNQRAFSCPVVLLLPGSENYGNLDPSPVLNYPQSIDSFYHGCTQFEEDAINFRRLLRQPNVLAVLYRQSTPIEHPKLVFVPLGPSSQFMRVFRTHSGKRDTLYTHSGKRDTLYYVNHSPWESRQRIFETVNKNFGEQLTNEFCSPTYGCTAGRMKMEVYLQRLHSARFVESPPGIGEDCYRHYESMLAGAVPVVQNTMGKRLKGFPRLSVASWSDVTPSMLQHAHVPGGNLQRLHKSYWVQFLKTLRQRSLVMSTAIGYNLSQFEKPAEMVANESLCLGVTAYQGVETLKHTLDSYVKHALFRIAKKIYIHFLKIDSPERRAWAEDVLRTYPDLEPLYSEGIELYHSLNALVGACSKHDYTMLLEEDFELVSHEEDARKQIENAVYMLKHGADAVRMRSRLNGGNPNHSLTQIQNGKKLPESHLISYVMNGDEPEKRVPEISVCRLEPKTWCTSSKHGHYTNNPVMYRSAFLKELLAVVPDNMHDFGNVEPYLTKWWSKQEFVLAWSEGIFKHTRLDRTLGKIGKTASLSAKKTVIIAAAIGYGIYEFKNFVIPLRKVYTGDVTLFVNAKLPSDVVELCKRHNIFTRALPTGSRLGVKGNRYIGYAEVCSNYQWCFATDFRDVFFQENPFLKLPNADLILFEEENHVKMGYRKDRPMCRPTVSIPCTCPYNANWIRTCWGNDFLSSIANETPICSGTIMGTPRGFAELKDKMLAEMDTTDSKDGCTARDQGHLNYLYFANQIDVPTVVQLRGEGIVNTVGYITPRTTINDHLKGGYVVNKDDKASAVVHQYDRFPELKALLRELVHWKKLINTPLDTPNQETPSASHLNIVPKDIEGTVGSQAGNHVDKLISNTLFQKDFVGTFVEFGCSNGIRNSNSLLLEREYGWNGLCIEPNPFEATFAIKNRKHGIHALLSYPAQDYKYAAMSGHCAQGSGIVEFMNEKSKNNLKTCPQARGEQLNYVTIPGVNLETLLEENHMPSVTWISADCEGCELTFIQNFDFDKYDVRVFSYETSANRETGAKIENLLAEKGFSKHNWKGNDAVYTRSLDRQTEGKPSSKIVTATEPLATPNQHTPNNDYVTNKKYIDMCTVSYKTRSKNDFRLPLTPNSIVCVKGDTATLTSFFQLNIRQPFTLVTIEMDDAVPQNALWLNHKYLKRWYSWNSKHSDVIPIPIGLNGDSQLDPMRQTTPVTPKIEMVLANFKQDRPVRVSLFNKVKDLSYVHVESYSQKWQNTQKLSAHYESISKYKWTLCPRGEGQDTHRLWEALYLGSIPIVLKSSISPLYEGLPVIQLNNWEELSLELLQERSKSLTMDRTNAYFKHWENTIRSQTNKIELPQASPNRVISYSLYGSNPRYTDGALANAKLVKDIYPDWIMRVYYDDTVPQKIIQQLRADGVQLVDMSGLKMNKMSWRFQAAKDAGRFCARDIDSRLSKREASAVQEWKESGKQFHVMRDHPSHSHYAMSGGMWCSTTIPNMQALLTNVENQAYLQDMNFLNKVIWPIAQKSLLQHDSFSCDKFGGGKPFPTPRVGWEHVGSVYINGKMRQGDVDILKQKGVVQQCSVLPSL